MPASRCVVAGRWLAGLLRPETDPPPDLHLPRPCPMWDRVQVPLRLPPQARFKSLPVNSIHVKKYHIKCFDTYIEY